MGYELGSRTQRHERANVDGCTQHVEFTRFMCFGGRLPQREGHPRAAYAGICTAKKVTNTRTSGIVNQTHSMRKLKDAIHEVAGRGLKVVDGRTAIGKALMRWRADLVQDLGGQQGLSTQQLAVVDIVVRTKLLLDSVDAWMVKQQAGLVEKRKRQLYPIVQQRTALADSLVRQLTTLGLGRKAKQEMSLRAYLAAREPSETARPEPEKTS
jgi:hypothetical protein